MAETPAMNLTDAAIARELTKLHKRWRSLDRESGGGGSPGEWIIERIGELEHEQKLRMLGVVRGIDVPLQSR